MPYDIGPQSSVPWGAANALKLADYLESLPTKSYDHSSWGHVEPCGTVACAMGHAGIAGLFNFTYAASDSGGRDRFRRVGDDRPVDPRILAVETFGINRTTASWLFENGYYGNGNDVDPRLVKLGYIDSRAGVIAALRLLAEIKIAEVVGVGDR